MGTLHNLQRRIEALEARVAQLEQLGPSTEPPRNLNAPPILPAPYIPAVPPAAPHRDPVASRPPPVPRTTASSGVIPYQPAPVRAVPVREGDWEQTIGLKWAGWVGALVLVIGAALAIKYSYEMWLSQASAELRLALMGAGGFVLIAMGEWVYRRVHVWSAVGLFGGGVATLFLVAYAGHGYFNLYSREAAFIAMACVTLLGAAVAMRGRMVSIAVVSLIGGNLVPLILSTGEARIVVLLGYLLMLQLVAVILAAWGGSARWWTLRWFALTTTTLWMAAILMMTHHRPFDYAPLVFAIVSAAIFQIELIMSALRQPADQPTGAAAATFSIAVTAVLVSTTLAALHEATPFVRGAWVLGEAAILSAAGFIIRRAAIISLVLRMQAAALVVIAVPVALSGAAVTIAWSALAVVYAAMGAKWDLSASRIAAVVTWTLAMLYVPYTLANDAGTSVLREMIFSQVPLYVALLWMGAMAGHAVAWLIALTRDEAVAGQLRTAAVTVSGFSTTAWVVAALAGLPAMWATVSLLAYAWLLSGVDVVPNRLRLSVQSVAVLVTTTLKWLLADLVGQWASRGWTASQLDYLPLVNPLMGMGVVLAISLASVWYLRRDTLRKAVPERSGTAGPALITIVVIGVAAALSMEIDRVIAAAKAAGWALAWEPEHVKQLCWTMLWSASTGLLGGLLWRMHDQPARRHIAISTLSIVLILLVAKFIVADTLAWRIMGWNQPGALLANLELLTAMVLLGVVSAAGWGLRIGAVARGWPSMMAQVIILVGVSLVLFAGTLEIDRGFVQFGGGAVIGKQVAWSIWWSIVAIGAVVCGFILRVSGLRYSGLALFALTVVKVFMVDLQGVSTGWRTLSFIGLGLLLMGTSVLYGKFSPRILNAQRAP